jgi:hypothetical protein
MHIPIKKVPDKGTGRARVGRGSEGEDEEGDIQTCAEYIN